MTVERSLPLRFWLPLPVIMVFVALVAIHDLSDPSAELWSMNLASWVLLVASMVVLIGFLHRYVMRPIRHLTSAARSIAEGQHGTLTDIRGSGEFATLGHAFNTMSQQLEARLMQSMEDAETLKKSETLLTAAGHMADVGGWELDAKTLEVSWTEQTYLIHELPVGQTPPLEDAISFYHPDDRSLLEEAVLAAIEQGTPYDLEVRFITAKGKQLWVQTLCKPVIEDGKTVKLVGTFQDITKRKRSEAELRQYERIVSSTTDMLALLDRDHTYLACNAAYAGAFAKKSHEVIGHTAPELFGREFFETIIQPRSERCLAGEEIQYQDWFEFPGYGRRYMDASLSPYFGASDEVQGFVVTARDITERTELEEQLCQAQKMEAVGLLAGGVAHDFNNMLLVILGQADEAIETLDPTNPLHDALIQIRTAAERSARLTRQLLAFARKQTITPQVLDLNKTVVSMLAMLRQLSGEAVEVAWQPGDELWSVSMDPSQIDQILANLCLNARDAMEDAGTVTIETGNVTVDEADGADELGLNPGEYVLLSVSDDGRGMDEQSLGRLYEPFFTTKKFLGGTGLGLATVYGIVKQNGAFINVRSAPGEGTTFKIHLPREEAQASPIPENPPAETALHGNESILLTEDEEAILRLTTRMLERQGYTVLPASTPGEAIRLAQEYSGEIHLLLTDVVLPEMNGRDLAQKLVPFCPNIRHLFMSGYTADVIADHGVLEKGVQFIEKPFRRQDLIAKVRETLNTP